MWEEAEFKMHRQSIFAANILLLQSMTFSEYIHYIAIQYVRENIYWDEQKTHTEEGTEKF